MTDPLNTRPSGGQKILSSQIKPKPAKSYKPYKPFIKYDHVFYGKKWYTNMVQSSERKCKCLMDDYRQEDLKSHLVICYTKQYTADYVQHLYAVFDSYIEFYNYYNQFALKDCCFYEVVQFYQKPHFDVDMDSLTYIEHYSFDKPYHYDEFCQVGTLLIETVIKACMILMRPNILILEKDILMYTSHGKSKGRDKLSYHIIINHWCHLDEIEAGAFFEKVAHLTACLLNGRYVEWLDDSVYKSRQNFRLVGSHKYDTAPAELLNRTKKFESEFMYEGRIIKHEPDVFSIAVKLSDFSKSLITFTSGCQLLQSFKEYKNYVHYEYYITDQDLEEIKTLLHKEFKDQFMIRDVKSHKVFLKKKNPYYCSICQRVHLHENPVITVFHGTVKFDCRRNEDKRKLLLGYLSVKGIVDDIVEEVDEGPDDTGNFLLFGDYKVDLTNGEINPIIKEDKEVKENIQEVKIIKKEEKQVIDEETNVKEEIKHINPDISQKSSKTKMHNNRNIYGVNINSKKGPLNLDRNEPIIASVIPQIADLTLPQVADLTLPPSDIIQKLLSLKK